MTAIVRVFFHTGIVPAHVSGGMRNVTDSVSMLSQPYLDKSKLTASTGAAESTSAAPANTRIAFIQVQEGKSVHYEVNPENRQVAATNNSPTLSGSTQVEFGPNWSLSFLEVSD